MPHRTFLLFIIPSLTAMVLFIALPLISIAYQSFFIERPRDLVVVQVCDPFGCEAENQVATSVGPTTHSRSLAGRFNGFGTYLNSTHLAVTEVKAIVSNSPNFTYTVRRIFDLPFYRALAFTLCYTFVVTPLSIALGFLLALAANALPKALLGSIMYVSMLPMIVPSLLGALVLFWMIDGRGVIGSALKVILHDPDLSLKASASLTWITMFAYGVWASTPYVFIVLYAALQTVPKDTLESAMIDGASRWMRVWQVVVPYLRPTLILVTVVSIMDNFRVFESIIGLSASAYASSLSILIFQDLMSSDTPLFGSAAASSMITIVCIAVLMSPSMLRSWNSFKQKA
jgi:ABC-type sugar transport system permease subunit